MQYGNLTTMRQIGLQPSYSEFSTSDKPLSREGSMSKTASMDQTDRERLHEKFAQLGLRGYWQNRRDSQHMEPKLWRWKDIHPVLMETTEVIRIGPDAFRRNVGLQTGSHTLC